MPRRVNLPGASELFRPTGAAPAGAGGAKAAGRPAAAKSVQAVPSRQAATGRVRHDEKITVYVSNDELILLEQARLALRQAGVVVDRGHLVRAAIATALDDLAARGVKADLVQRLGS
ncbi:MAG: hypothetical protein LBI84_04520 [Propionibacteriaceae bacterium]|jgi:hypothetical protein|nr:hypothetical protein [Propionibacteriaceae bacterium]